MIDQLKNQFSVKEIDDQIILAISLQYEKIPFLLQFFSEPKIEKKAFFHNDKTFLFHLITNKISFPLSIIYFPHASEEFQSNTLILEQSLYEEIKKQNKLDLLKEKIKKNIIFKKDQEISIQIREKEKIEEIIDNDDIDLFRLISNENNFHLFAIELYTTSRCSRE